MGRDYDAAQGAISQRRYLSLCSCNAQRAASWGIGLFAVFAATLNQRAVLLLFLSFCVGLIPRKIKSTQNDEEPKSAGQVSKPLAEKTDMDQTALQDFMDEIHWLFNPEADEDGIAPREFPNKRIREHYKLDMSYMESFDWEGSSVHKYTRLCPTDEQRIHVLTRNQDVPDRLFGTALRLYADSIIEYHDKKEKEGVLKFYPPVLLTFWAGFETFVRYSSELLIAT